MKIQILQSYLMRISFGEAISFRGDSLLLEMFIKTNTIGIMLNLSISTIENKFPFF